MCASIYGILYLKKGQTIAQLIVRKKNAMTKLFPDDTAKQATEGQGDYDANAITIKSEAMHYIQEILLKIGTAAAPDVILSGPHLPRNRKAFSSLRKSNLIQLFTGMGSGIVICYRFGTFFPPCTSRMLSSGIDDKK